ncbi:MAG: sensor histidine kinase, partial [Chloroflexota bacterium]
AVLSTLPAGVAILEAPSGRIIAANDAAERLWGHPLLPDTGLSDLHRAYGLYRRNGDLYSVGDLPIARSLDQGEVVVGEEVLLRRADGKDYPVLLSCAPLYDGERLDAVVAVFQDTSRMELERVKDQFVSVTAHELFTPLTVIKGMTQLLERQAADTDNPTLTQALRVIDGRANWMTFLVQKLVDAAELQLDPLRLRLSRIDLSRLVGNACRRVQTTTPSHIITCRCEGEALMGEWDRDRIDRVLNNLLENAIKYSPGGGPIEVEVSRATGGSAISPAWIAEGAEWAMVRVRDHGIGIPKEHLPNLFRRFYRAGPGEYQESAGLGLGLYITNRIVAAHGGRVGVESEEGLGSTFYFALPLAPQVTTGETHPIAPARL